MKTIQSISALAFAALSVFCSCGKGNGDDPISDGTLAGKIAGSYNSYVESSESGFTTHKVYHDGVKTNITKIDAKTVKVSVSGIEDKDIVQTASLSDNGLGEITLSFNDGPLRKGSFKISDSKSFTISFSPDYSGTMRLVCGTMPSYYNILGHFDCKTWKNDDSFKWNKIEIIESSSGSLDIHIGMFHNDETAEYMTLEGVQCDAGGNVSGRNLNVSFNPAAGAAVSADVTGSLNFLKRGISLNITLSNGEKYTVSK